MLRCIETGTKGRPRKYVNGKLVLVTRWMMGVLDNPEVLVLHKCNNYKCIRRSHLYLGTYSDNNRDRRQADRYKLTLNEAKEIRQLCKQGVPKKEISGRYKVSRSLVQKIHSGVTRGK